MIIYLCSDAMDLINQSGVGRAIEHQQMALKSASIPYTLTDEKTHDVIHINTVFPSSYIRAKRAKKNGIPVVYHAHSTENDFKNSFFFANALAPLAGWWFKKCYETADLILTPSEYSKMLLEEWQMKPPIKVISNGIDLSYWQSTLDEQKIFREKLGIQAEDKLIISVGLQIKRKGILDFVEMAKRMPEYQFIWFGYTDPKLLSREIKEAIQSDLPNLQFPGYIDRNEVRIAYQACDLYLFLTHEETEGIVLLEALASKANTIVRDIPVFNPDYIDRKDVYKANSLDDFIHLTRGILDEKLPSLVDTGYQKVSEKSIDKIGQQLKEHYQSVLWN